MVTKRYLFVSCLGKNGGQDFCIFPVLNISTILIIMVCHQHEHDHFHQDGPVFWVLQRIEVFPLPFFVTSFSSTPHPFKLSRDRCSSPNQMMICNAYYALLLISSLRSIFAVVCKSLMKL